MSIEIVLITFFIGVALGLWWVPYQKKVGLTSRDIYKDLEAVPRAGGVIAMVAATVGFLLTAPHVPYASAVAVVALAIGLIGLVDDVRGVSEYVRVLFPVFLALVVVRAIEEVRLTIPVVGLFYGATGWLSALAIPVMTNAFNMLDPVNGFLPAANIIIGLTLIGVAAVKGLGTRCIYWLYTQQLQPPCFYIINTRRGLSTETWGVTTLALVYPP